jgi:hypothetical protein
VFKCSGVWGLSVNLQNLADAGLVREAKQRAARQRSDPVLARLPVSRASACQQSAVISQQSAVSIVVVKWACVVKCAVNWSFLGARHGSRPRAPDCVREAVTGVSKSAVIGQVVSTVVVMWACVA